MLLDDDVLIDGGTGVGDLEIEALAKIDHVFVTHSHMDHVAFIPLMVDTVGWMRDKPVTLHATAPTLEILKEHLFNWKLWPDFTQIPDRSAPYLKFETIEVGRTVELGARRITALPAQHVVPAVGFHVDGGRMSLVFTGDTTANRALWEAVNKIENLRYLVIETAFSNGERPLAVASKHLCPSMLAEELQQLKREADIYITHLKPGEIELIMQEIEACTGDRQPQMLTAGQVFEL
jgi:cAMP phosphodiesterase